MVMAFSRFIKISIHAPLRERPNKLAEAEAIYAISIHAPLRERRRLRHLEDSTTRISIHAPLRERPWKMIVAMRTIKFQSTLPCGSDHNRRYHRGWSCISIHAPLRERHQCGRGTGLPYYFNPRSLAGATPRRLWQWTP